MQRYVAIVVKLAHWNAEPERRPDLHDSIDSQVQELAFPQAGAGQELHCQANEGILVTASGTQQLRCCRVVEEAWQRLIFDREVPREDGHAGGSVVPPPLDDALEEVSH